MSVPDYAEMGRELEANRDATLVNAANRGVKYHEELKAANQRIAELQQRIESVGVWDDLAETEKKLEEAERKLAAALTALADIRKYIDNFDGSWDIDHIYGLVMYGLAQIEQPEEQPKQQLPDREDLAYVIFATMGKLDPEYPSCVAPTGSQNPWDSVCGPDKQHILSLADSILAAGWRKA